MKQEEIREGIKNFVSTITEGGEDGAELREDDWDGSWADSILKYLHSQGVVLKVDKELPKNPHGFTDRERRLHLYECCESCHKAERESMLKAGYVAIEPLIKE